MAIRDQLDRIIAVRREKCDALKRRKARLQDLKTKLKDSTAGLTMGTKDIKDDQLRMQYGSVFGNINSYEVQRRIDRLLRRMDDGIKRFDRDYISIATVGKERQGKSQFLQSVGDLDNDIIPAYDATSCTGATSIIWNAPNLPKGSVRATITFRQPQELIDIVTPYIRELDASYLESNPLSFDDVAYINLPRLAACMETGNASQASAYKHLSSIVERFGEIRELFGSSPCP